MLILSYYIFNNIQGWTEKFVSRKVYWLESSYGDVISAIDDFLSMGSKHCNIIGRGVWNTRWTRWKIDLVRLLEYLGQSMIFSADPRIYDISLSYLIIYLVSLSILFSSFVSEVKIVDIIMSCHQHGYPWLFLATLLYRPLLPAGLQGYIPYRHRAAVCRV